MSAPAITKGALIRAWGTWPGCEPAFPPAHGGYPGPVSRNTKSDGAPRPKETTS